MGIGTSTENHERERLGPSRENEGMPEGSVLRATRWRLLTRRDQADILTNVSYSALHLLGGEQNAPAMLRFARVDSKSLVHTYTRNTG
jgi:hypothetical protein